MQSVVYIKAIPLKEEVTCSFIFKNCYVRSAADLSEFDIEKNGDHQFGYLIITIPTYIKEFDPIAEAAVTARPLFLILLDILSLFMNRALTPFESGYQVSEILEEVPRLKKQAAEFFLNTVNYSEAMNQFLVSLEGGAQENQRYFYSLMDRWRKAVFMQEESAENQLYDDETVIAYFHVLELLSEEHSKELNGVLINKINDFLQDVYGNILQFEGSYLDSIKAAKFQLNKQLITADLPIKGKILFVLNKFDLMSPRLNFFIGNWIKERNNVAHGRRVYQDKVIFPVPPFFSNAKFNDFTLDTLRYLTAHLICKIVGDIDIYEDEWYNQHDLLLATPEEVKAFFQEESYLDLTFEQFTEGEKFQINPGTISWYLVDNRLKPEHGYLILRDYFFNMDHTNSWAISQSVLSAIILADQGDEEFQAVCEKIIISSYTMRAHQFFNLREVLSFLEFNNHKVRFLESMISAGKVN